MRAARLWGVRMARRPVELTFRGNLLSSASSVSLAKARMVLLPIVAGAAMAVSGVALAPSPALAADVLCSPNASGAPLTLSATNCVGAGDGINFPSATVSSSVTLESLNISGGAAYGVTITTGGNNINVADSLFSGSITTATAGSDGFNIIAGGGNISLNLTNTASGVSISAIDNGIDLNTGGAGTITVNTIANVVGGTYGIISTAGNGNTTMTVRNVTGTAGRGILAQTNGAGNVNVTTSGNVTGGQEGIYLLGPLNGTGNLTLTVNSGSNVTTTVPASYFDILMLVPGGGNASGNILLNMNGNATARGVNTINFGTGNVTINSSGNITGTASNGINAATGTGNISITQTAGNITSISAVSAGINAVSTTGNIVITAGSRV